MKDRDKINVAGIAGILLDTVKPLAHPNYQDRDYYHAYVQVERGSGIVDTLPLIIPMEATEVKKEDMERVYAAGTEVTIVGKIQTLRNYETKSSEVSIYAVYIVQGYSRHQNQLQLTGTIENNIVYRTTPLGKYIADIMLYIPSSMNDGYYCKVPCIAWQEDAAAMKNRNILPDDTIKINGRLQSRIYYKRHDDAHGDIEFEERVAYEVSIFNWDLLEKES